MTVFTKDGGPLTKTIRLGDDGKPISDSTKCKMAKGSASRVLVDGVEGLAALIAGLASNQAIALGALRPDLGDRVGVTTKDKLNGERVILIARTANDIIYRKDKACFGLFDLDQKGMPPEVRERIKDVGYWKVLVEVLPELAHAARVIRTSTSSGLRRTHRRSVRGLWWASRLHHHHGWHRRRALAQDTSGSLLARGTWLDMGQRTGTPLKRSIVDSTVWGSERLVFEDGLRSESYA